MYISNNAIILPLCNIRVEICLYIIIALPRLILFSIPSSLFLTWCSYIKYLSKLKLQCSRSVCWLGGGEVVAGLDNDMCLSVTLVLKTTKKERCSSIQIVSSFTP